MLAYLGVLKNCKALIFVSTIDAVSYTHLDVYKRQALVARSELHVGE